MLALIALAALLVLGAGWYLTRADPQTNDALTRAPTAPDADLTEIFHPLDEPPSPRDRVALQASRNADGAQDRAPDTLRAGTVTVRARLEGGGTPETWTLDLEDVTLLARDPGAARTSLSVAGSEIVVGRRLDALHRLRGRAVGLASPTRSSSLTIEHSTADVELVLAPAAVVEGRVVDEQDQPVAARGVWLRPLFDSRAAGEPAMDLYTRTEQTGDFRFVDVLPGRWSVAVGERASPLMRLDGIEVTLPATRIDTIRLPRLFTLALRVVDEHGLVVTDARLWSRGSNGGVFDVAADAYGEARVSELPAGRWRVFAQSPSRGRANVAIELPRSYPDEAVLLSLRPRR